MSEQEKAALEAEQAEVETTEVETEAKDEETSTGAEPDEASKQLEAALQREKEALEAKQKAEKALADKAFKFRAKKRELEEPTEETQEDEKPLTRSEFLSLMAEEREEREKKSLESEARRLATSLAASEQEAEGILMAWQNRKFPPNLSLGEQLEESYFALNKKKILGENSELKRALLGKSNVSKDASTTHHDSPTGTAPSVDAEMAQLGYKFNTRTKRLEKKLPDGRILFVDPKSGKNSIAA